jgi:hypothetical protein
MIISTPRKGLPILRGDVLDPGDMRLDVIHREYGMNTRFAGRIVNEPEIKFWPPGLPRPDRAWREAATARRTDIHEDIFDAVGTISAFVSANPGIRGPWRQVLVTQLAVRSDFQHD